MMRVRGRDAFADAMRLQYINNYYYNFILYIQNARFCNLSNSN